MEEIINRGASLSQVLDVDCYLIPEETSLSQYKKVPITEIASIGAGMSSLPTVFRTATTEMVTNTSNLYELKNGITLKKASDGSGLLRGFEMGSKGIKKQGLFESVEGLNTTVKTTMPINPATMCMAVAIIGLDKKMDRIIEIEKTLLDEFVAKERAQLRNNIDFLSEMLRDYKDNWNNELFLSGNYSIALQIKKEAGTYIKKYKDLIEQRLSKNGLIKGDAEVNKDIKNIANYLNEYQIAVYVYAFSSFVELLLKGNFKSDYLRRASDRIEEYSVEYRELYTKVYNNLLSKADSTIESQVLGMLSNLGKAAGELAAKSPALDVLDVDDVLKKGSKNLSKINSTKKNKELSSLENKQAVYIRPFIDNIAVIDRVYNEPLQIMFDDDYVYFPKVV